MTSEDPVGSLSLFKLFCFFLSPLSVLTLTYHLLIIIRILRTCRKFTFIWLLYVKSSYLKADILRAALTNPSFLHEMLFCSNPTFPFTCYINRSTQVTSNSTED